MKPAPFAYLRPTSLDEALDALRTRRDAHILAGGQSLIAMLNLRLLRPALLIDIQSLRELDDIALQDDAVIIGAGVTQEAALAHPSVRTHVPLLHRSLPLVGHYQTRSRGTVCGSIAHADPAAELPLALAVLGGDVMLRARRHRRTVPATAFFHEKLLTHRRPEEMLVATRWPCRTPRTGYAIEEFCRRHVDAAIVAAAARVRQMRDGTITARLGLGGVSGRPMVIEGIFTGTWDAMLQQAAQAVTGGDDLHASRAYRQDLARSLARRVLETALAESEDA